MAAAKGTRPPNAGKGREKGVPNRATTEFRDTVRQLLEDNRENVSIWLKRVAAKNPGKALDVLGNLAEFAAPKLSRAEHVGDGGGPMVVNVIKLSE